MGTAQSIVKIVANQTLLHHPDGEDLNKIPKVFTSVGEDILDNAFKGYNACIFAYGQTGSGKSYTMMGSQGQAGIIPRLCNNLFERIETMSGPENQTKVEVSYME